MSWSRFRLEEVKEEKILSWCYGSGDLEGIYKTLYKPIRRYDSKPIRRYDVGSGSILAIFLGIHGRLSRVLQLVT